ncbi:hypothetical protein EauM23_00032 [Exiguobacterium phage vB_EauM-23]|nr:hypothetical protein EauM23_00032 [Exiguobacterium phage vB_EauM-23]
MKDLKFKNGDLILSGNDFQMVEGIDDVGQSVESTLGTNLGEFELEPELGIVYLNMVGKGIAEEDIQAEIFAGLSQEERIESVSEIEVDRDNTNRNTTVRFSAVTDTGETIESEVDLNVG